MRAAAMLHRINLRRPSVALSLSLTAVLLTLTVMKLPSAYLNKNVLPRSVQSLIADGPSWFGTEPVATSQTWTTSAFNVPTNVQLVETHGNLTHRIHQLNAFLHELRATKYVPEVVTKPWVSPGPQVSVIQGFRDDYISLLANYSRTVSTVALPWLRPPSGQVWDSLDDTNNLLVQSYYPWTVDDPLCTWIETPGVIKMKYDVIFNRTCSRNINDSSTPSSLEPTFLNGKPIFQGDYWPNEGKAFPAYFFTEPPPFVTHIHVYRDAVVTHVGDVYTADVKVVVYGCMPDYNPALPLGGKFDGAPLYDELFVISQYWGSSVFHRMVEVVPRVALYIEFLLANPQIRVLAPETSGGRLGEIFQILGLDPARLVAGVARAKVVYQPRPTGCGFANAVESQVLSRIYRDYIWRRISTSPTQSSGAGITAASPRNKIVLIRRSGSRRFTEQSDIEKVVSKAAADFNLTFSMFIDNPTPSLEETMKLFHSAVVVVGPHGAGLSNVIFSEPGTFVLEGVCNLPHVNFCFQRLAHNLGHHWHGVPSRGGCEGVVDVPATSIDAALRQFLRMSTEQRTASEPRLKQSQQWSKL